MILLDKKLPKSSNVLRSYFKVSLQLARFWDTVYLKLYVRWANAPKQELSNKVGLVSLSLHNVVAKNIVVSVVRRAVIRHNCEFSSHMSRRRIVIVTDTVTVTLATWTQTRIRSRVTSNLCQSVSSMGWQTLFTCVCLEDGLQARQSRQERRGARPG